MSRKHYWILAVVLAAAALFMYVSILFKMSPS